VGRGSGDDYRTSHHLRTNRIAVQPIVLAAKKQKKSRGGWDDLQTEFTSFALQILDSPYAHLGIIFSSPQCLVGCFLLQHVIDNSSNLMRRGHNR